MVAVDEDNNSAELCEVDQSVSDIYHPKHIITRSLLAALIISSLGSSDYIHLCDLVGAGA